MNNPTRCRRAACRCAARTLATATAMAALIATLSVGQALAGPDERVLERQGRIDRQGTTGQGDEQGKSSFPTFVRILLSALAVGMIRGHDDHRRHPRSRPAVAGDPAAAAHPTTPLRRPAPYR